MAKITDLRDVEKTTDDSATLVLQELKEMKAKIASLEKSNEELKKDSRIGTSTEQINYNWPLLFSVKTWNGKIISDYVSTKKEPNKDFIFKNQYGEWVDNQQITLTYTDGTEEKVMYNQFSSGVQKSERNFASGYIKQETGKSPIISRNNVLKVATDGKEHEFFVFTIDGERVEICDKCIN